jgi:phosphoribosylformylglycinamidine synthase
VRVLIPVGLGLNCEEETAAAMRRLGARVDLAHLTDLLSHRSEQPLAGYHVLAMVGGFSYGDHVAGGFVLATRLRAHLLRDLSEFLARGGLMLGICNGFQTMVRLGVLPGPEAGGHDFVPRADLGPNDRLGYRDAWVRMRADPSSHCVWTRGLEEFEMPARHGEGKFLVSSTGVLDDLERRGQLALRYVDAGGEPTECWPANPNGSARGVAGVCDSSGRVLGLMPHPDAFLHPWHHPAWRHSPRIVGSMPAGLRLFEAGLRAARESL